MHLNEEFLYIEPEWLDERRFVPIITDFTRTTQPIVRYRLDDVLVASDKPCACGSATRALERIEGRQDDQLLLPGSDGTAQTVFADPCSRVLAQMLPLTADYRLMQIAAGDLELIADCNQTVLEQCRVALERLFTCQGIDTSRLAWSLVSQTPPTQFDSKRRRIICQWRRE